MVSGATRSRARRLRRRWTTIGTETRKIARHVETLGVRQKRRDGRVVHRRLRRARPVNDGRRVDHGRDHRSNRRRCIPLAVHRSRTRLSSTRTNASPYASLDQHCEPTGCARPRSRRSNRESASSRKRSAACVIAASGHDAALVSPNRVRCTSCSAVGESLERGTGQARRGRTNRGERRATATRSAPSRAPERERAAAAAQNSDEIAVSRRSRSSSTVESMRFDCQRLTSESTGISPRARAGRSTFPRRGARRSNAPSPPIISA